MRIAALLGALVAGLRGKDFAVPPAPELPEMDVYPAPLRTRSSSTRRRRLPGVRKYPANGSRP